MLMPLLLWIFIILVILPPWLLAMFVCAIYRLIVNFIAWASRPDLVGHLTSRDIVFTSDDFDGKVRKNLTNCAIVDGPIDLEEFRVEVKKRLMDKPYYWRLNCRPVTFMGYYFWQKQEYQIDAHITEFERRCTEKEILTVLPAWSQEPYNEQGPLWAILVVPLFGNRTALVFKMHHMNGDGVCFMKLLSDYVDADPPWKDVDIKGPRPFSWLHWAYAWYNWPWVCLKAYRLAQGRKGFRPRGLCGEGFTCFTMLPSEKIKTIRRIAKCQFTTVLAGILSNAFYRILLDTGRAADIPTSVRVVVPVPWPNRPKNRLSNHVAFVHAELPLGGGLKDFYEFEKTMKQSYISGLHGIVWSIFRGMYVAPTPILHRYTWWGERKIPPAIISSIPGPTNDVNILGNKVLESQAIISLGCTMGMNAAITSTAEVTNFSLRVSKEILPSQELCEQLVKEYLHEELEFFYQKLMQEEQDKNQPKKEHHIKIEMS